MGHGKRRREIPNPGAIAREAQASGAITQEGDQSDVDRGDDGVELPNGARGH